LSTIATDDRSELADKKVQSEQKIFVEKDAKSSDDEIAAVPISETTVATENLHQAPVQLHAAAESDNKVFYKKPETPKKEEVEQTVSKAEKRKIKNENSEATEMQQQSAEEKIGGDSGGSGYANTPQPASPNGNTTAAATPSANSQSNTGAQTIVALSSLANESPKKTSKRGEKSDSGSYRNEIKAGKKRYKSKEYDQAVLLFTKTLQTKPEDREALFFLGSSYLELNKIDLAIVQFDKLIKSGAGIYYDDARYNKAMALIKQNKNTDAKILLKELIQTSTEYKARATKALNEIK
jgi:tetratricopeptide (TPR) repeat protein